MPTRPSHDCSVLTSPPLSPCLSTRPNGEPLAARAGPLRVTNPADANIGTAITAAISSARNGARCRVLLPGPRIFGTRANLPQREGFQLGLTPTGLADGLVLD